MLYITVNISVLNQILEILEKHSAKSYQVIERTWAKPLKGQKRFDDAVWPGYNAIIMLQADNALLKLVTLDLRHLNDTAHNDNELITWADWELNSFTAE